MNSARKTRVAWILSAALASAAALPAHVQAANKSVVSSADNTLIQDATGSVSDGAGPDIFVGVVGFSGGNTKRRGVIRFDLSAIPAFSYINSASLTLQCSQSNSGAASFELHKATASWGEGTSVGFGGTGGPSTAGDATWLHRFYNDDPSQAVFWTNPGGDFVSTASAAISVGVSGTYTWNSTSGLIANVQSWVDSASNNFGWLLKSDELNTQIVKKFFSRESGIGKPALAIQYFIGGDANGDDMVDLTDFTFVAANFNQTNRTHAQGDFNRDGSVDLTDFTILASNFNKSAPPADVGASVPEPATITVLASVVGMLGFRRRSRRSA